MNSSKTVRRWRIGIQFLFIVMAIVMLMTLIGCDRDKVAADTQITESTTSVETTTKKGTSELTVEEKAVVDLFQQGKYEATITKADAVLLRKPDSDIAYSVKGMALGLLGEPKKGLELAQKAYSLNEKNVSNYYNLAMLYKLQGQLDESAKWFRRVLEVEPHNTWSLYGLATIYADEGHDAEALIWLKRAIETDSTVKSVAREQDHFMRFYNNEKFKQLTQ